MSFLRAFFLMDFDDVAPFLDQYGFPLYPDYMGGVRIIFNGSNVAECFNRSHHFPDELLDNDDSEESLKDSLLRGETHDHMLEKLGVLGFHDIDLKGQGGIFRKCAEEFDVGFAVRHINVGCWQATHLEVGSDETHLRIMVRDCWDGSPFPTQIDRVTLWSTKTCYDIPCGAHDTIAPLQHLLLRVESTVEALLNGDDEEAYNVFATIPQKMKELLPENAMAGIKTRSPS